MAEPGTSYETSCWLAHDGQVNALVAYLLPGCSFAIQGSPAGLRELAAALTATASQAEQAEPVVPLPTRLSAAEPGAPADTGAPR